ncbi:uncharacterized protein DS421_1g30200 [Arachis hypogaea]|nr:uncharacterized protein DS421_1g30200 [Arachis hypogaea]
MILLKTPPTRSDLPDRRMKLSILALTPHGSQLPMTNEISCHISQLAQITCWNP